MPAIWIAMRARLTMIQKDTEASVERNLLKLAISAMDTLAASKSQGGKSLTAEQEIKEVKKIFDGTVETMEAMRTRNMQNDPRFAVLLAENKILAQYLPAILNKDDIRESLVAIEEEIKGAKSEGQATGMAMKHFKSQVPAPAVDGNDVTVVVKQMRDNG